jgi:hypothetical protein
MTARGEVPAAVSQPEVAMSRRSTPERLDAARHAATRNRLIGEARMSEGRADEWLARWAAQASQEGRERNAAYWDAAYK